MKITSVDIIDVANDFASATSKWRPVVVKINTDEGISGFGEVGLAYGVGASAGIGMAKDLAAIIIGMDPMNNEAIWEKMLKKTFWGQGGGGIFSAAMSGIDIALWDIKGKAWGVPLYKMLGGKSREKIRTYASQLQFGWGDSLSEQTPHAGDHGGVIPSYFAPQMRCLRGFPQSFTQVSAWRFTRLPLFYSTNARYNSGTRLHVEAFAATTLIFHIRVGEFKPFVQTFFYEVQLCTVQKLQALAVNHYLNAFVFKHGVFRRWLVNKFQYISHT